MRTPFILFNCLLEVIGVAVLGFATQNPVRYFGAFLIIGGANSNIALVLTYQANNIVGQWRRAFCSATIVGAGGMGGIIGSLTFRSQDAPNYRSVFSFLCRKLLSKGIKSNILVLADPACTHASWQL
jgi:hypothetical protein